MRRTILIGLLVFPLGACGDATGPDEHFMTATVNGAQWVAGSGTPVGDPHASLWDGRLFFSGGAGPLPNADHLGIFVSGIPAQPGTYLIEEYVDLDKWNPQTPPVALVRGFRGTPGNPGFESLFAYSRSGEVTIDTITGTWVTGTFWFRAGGGSLGSVSVSDGRYRLRFQ